MVSQECPQIVLRMVFMDVKRVYSQTPPIKMISSYPSKKVL